MTTNTEHPPDATTKQTAQPMTWEHRSRTCLAILIMCLLGLAAMHCWLRTRFGPIFEDFDSMSVTIRPILAPPVSMILLFYLVVITLLIIKEMLITDRHRRWRINVVVLIVTIFACPLLFFWSWLHLFQTLLDMR